jgi:hypothetical protein
MGSGCFVTMVKKPRILPEQSTSAAFDEFQLCIKATQNTQAFLMKF